MGLKPVRLFGFAKTQVGHNPGQPQDCHKSWDGSRTMKKVLVVVSFLTALLGCQSAEFDDPASEYYRFKEGTKLVIERQIRIPPGRTNVWFQYGELRGANQFEPFCRLYVYGKPVGESRTVQPGEFTIRRWERARRLVWHDGNPLMYAQVRVFGGDGPSHVTWGRYFYLEGGEEPRPRMLMCGQLGDWSAVTSANGYVSFDQILETLGDYMTLIEP
jgi:hypothetical protein